MIHDYISTACRHGRHEDCRATCKWCGAACGCKACEHKAPAMPLTWNTILYLPLREENFLDELAHGLVTKDSLAWICELLNSPAGRRNKIGSLETKEPIAEPTIRTFQDYWFEEQKRAMPETIAAHKAYAEQAWDEAIKKAQDKIHLLPECWCGADHTHTGG
jgi:hypothetical protein